MKAIKLASVFAVSAVAAAISTTTFAAEPTFKGSAGLEYASYDDKSNDKDAAFSAGEVNIIGTVGSVYFDVDMNNVGTGKTGGGTFVLDEIYTTQGAVQFGDFNGSLADAAAFNAGVEEDNDGQGKQTLGDHLGVRYAVSDELKVAVEILDGKNKGALAFNYSTEFSGLTLGVSGAFRMSEAGDNNIITAGVQAPLGMATLSSYVQFGSLEKADVMNTGIGLDLPLSEQFSVAAQYYVLGGESKVGTDHKDQGVSEVTASYKVGDVKYYASMVAYEADNKDYSVVGAKVSF